MRLYSVIIKPILTEKTYAQIETMNKYTFEVARDANKTEIAQAFHSVFKVKPIAVNVSNLKPQNVRTGTKHPGVSSHVKKAVITLPPGTKLNILGDKDKADEPSQAKAEPAVEDKKATKAAAADAKKAIEEVEKEEKRSEKPKKDEGKE